MVVERYIINTLADISLDDLVDDNSVSCSSSSNDSPDNGFETSSQGSESISLLNFEDISIEATELQILRCDDKGQMTRPLPFAPSEVNDPLNDDGLGNATNNLYNSKSYREFLPSLEDATLLSDSTSLCEFGEWQKSNVATIPRFQNKDLRKSNRERQQCTFCGKYEKPDKPHIRCELCGFATYCRTKCQTRDRQRHCKHDCLVCETTPWFSIGRNKNNFLELADKSQQI